MRENRRRQIMDAALELFASEGYSHCSISQLAQHVGVSKGLMYNYFNSKEALLVSIIEEGVADIMSMIDPNHDENLKPEEVEVFIRDTFKGIQENVQFWILFINVVLQPPVKEFLNGEPFTNVMDRFAPKLIEYFKKMGFEDPMLEMLTFSAMIEGYGVLLVYIYPDEALPLETIKKYEDRMVNMFTRNPHKK